MQPGNQSDDMLSSVHPTIAAAFKPLMLHRADCGRKPTYLTMRDATEYDYGWCVWPNKARRDMDGTPQAKGWDDHESEYLSLRSRDQIDLDEYYADKSAERLERES